MILHRQVSQILSSLYIGLYCLRHILFHHWHMLVCSSMKYIIGFRLFKYFLQTGFVGNVHHNRFCLHLSPSIPHLQPQRVQWSFGLINQYQAKRIECRHLSHNLASNRASCSRNHHPFALQMASNVFHVDRYLFAGQQILYFNLLKLLFGYLLAPPFTQRQSCGQ